MVRSIRTKFLELNENGSYVPKRKLSDFEFDPQPDDSYADVLDSNIK